LGRNELFKAIKRQVLVRLGVIVQQPDEPEQGAAADGGGVEAGAVLGGGGRGGEEEEEEEEEDREEEDREEEDREEEDREAQEQRTPSTNEEQRSPAGHGGDSRGDAGADRTPEATAPAGAAAAATTTAAAAAEREATDCGALKAVQARAAAADNSVSGLCGLLELNQKLKARVVQLEKENMDLREQLKRFVGGGEKRGGEVSDKENKSVHELFQRPSPKRQKRAAQQLGIGTGILEADEGLEDYGL
jgi:hypothetical protein